MVHKRKQPVQMFGEIATKAYHCAKCGAEVDLVLPVEPLYDMALVAAILPMRRDALSKWLRYPSRKQYFPHRYRVVGSVRRRIRVFTATEVRLMRSLMTEEFPPGESPMDWRRKQRLKDEQNREQTSETREGQKSDIFDITG